MREFYLSPDSPASGREPSERLPFDVRARVQELIDSAIPHNSETGDIDLKRLDRLGIPRSLAALAETAIVLGIEEADELAEASLKVSEGYKWLQRSAERHTYSPLLPTERVRTVESQEGVNLAYATVGKIDKALGPLELVYSSSFVTRDREETHLERRHLVRNLVKGLIKRGLDDRATQLMNEAVEKGYISEPIDLNKAPEILALKLQSATEVSDEQLAGYSAVKEQVLESSEFLPDFVIANRILADRGLVGMDEDLVEVLSSYGSLDRREATERGGPRHMHRVVNILFNRLEPGELLERTLNSIYQWSVRYDQGRFDSFSRQNLQVKIGVIAQFYGFDGLLAEVLKRKKEKFRRTIELAEGLKEGDLSSIVDNRAYLRHQPNFGFQVFRRANPNISPFTAARLLAEALQGVYGESKAERRQWIRQAFVDQYLSGRMSFALAQGFLDAAGERPWELRSSSLATLVRIALRRGRLESLLPKGRWESYHPRERGHAYFQPSAFILRQVAFSTLRAK